jgi:hypothetical protein
MSFASTLFLQYLSSNQACIIFGFGAGMIWSIIDDKTAPLKIYFDRQITTLKKDTYSKKYNIDILKLSFFEDPITSFSQGCINGYLIVCCVTFVSEYLPYTFKPLVPMWLTLSVVNSVYKKYYTYKNY